MLDVTGSTTVSVSLNDQTCGDCFGQDKIFLLKVFDLAISIVHLFNILIPGKDK